MWQPDAGHVPIFPDSQNFLAFVQQYSSNISPQALKLMQAQGILTYANNVVVPNAEVYSSLTTGIINANGVQGLNNGWYILPALSGAALFLQQKFNPQASNAMGANPMLPMADGEVSPEQEQAQGCSSKVMLWMMPIFSIWICLSSPASFALYWFFSSLYAFAQGRVIDFINKKREKKPNVVIS